MNTIQSTIASAERVFDVLDQEEMKDTSTDTPVKQTDNLLEMDHVKFGYDDNELLMKDYNLAVKPGQQVAIVGPTGAGKTTIINLLERFYDVKGGAILLNGQDTRNMDREDLRSHFAMVLQDTWLFTGSIFDNIKYGREDATEDQVINAAKAAHVDEFVRRLPDGYDTVLNEDDPTFLKVNVNWSPLPEPLLLILKFLSWMKQLVPSILEPKSRFSMPWDSCLRIGPAS